MPFALKENWEIYNTIILDLKPIGIGRCRQELVKINVRVTGINNSIHSRARIQICV